MSVLAVHAGSTLVHATVVDGDRGAVDTHRRALPQHAPEPGWVEVAPEDLWRAVLDTARDALARAGAHGVERVELTNDPGTLVLWDRDTLGAPRRAVAAADRRTTQLCARLRDAGHEARVRELTGLPIEESYAAPRLTWLAEHEPRPWALVVSGRYAVGTVDSYLVARMTRGLEHVTDLSNASDTLLLDRAAGDWSDELCQVFGVPRDALPELVSGPDGAGASDPRTFLDLAVPITIGGTTGRSS